jgi:hypothetical protein
MSPARLTIGGRHFEGAMTTIAKVISLAFAFPASSAEAEILEIVMIFCGVGMLISLSLACCGVNVAALIF